MTEDEHTFTKTGRQYRVSYTTIDQWIVDAWAMVSVSSVVWAFMKTRIIGEQASESCENDFADDEKDPNLLDVKITQLFNSDIECEKFKG